MQGHNPRTTGGWTLGLLVAGLLVLGGCYTVPETGRSSLVLIDFPTEIRMGLAAFQQVKKERAVSNDPEANAMVERVGRRIAAVADRDIPRADWEFVTFDDDTPNAFALPGGKVGVHTGILPIAQDDAGLATVISHEIAHVVARHGAERISEGLVLGVAGTALGAAIASQEDRYRQMAMIAFGVGSTLGISLPHSRRAELEADHIGLTYMAKAGYDPRSAVGFWERMAAYGREQGSGSLPEFLSTHPVDGRRIEQVKRLLPRAIQTYDETLRTGLVPGVGDGASAPVVRSIVPEVVRARPMRALIPAQP